MDKRVLVLGSSGELGHKMLQVLFNEKFDVCGTIRGQDPKAYNVINKYPLISGVDVNNFTSIERAIDTSNPSIVINCIGIVKQLSESNNAEVSYKINAVLPHKLATYCNAKNIKVIHISTDCVFDGKSAGMYKETDIPNDETIYGMSKFAGELNDDINLTLRTSIIGRELFTRHGFVEWFLANRGKKCDGYERSIFSGVTTIELSRAIANIISHKNSRMSLSHQRDLTGLYHLAALPINKYDLCNLINSHLPLKQKVKINRVDGEVINRSLDASKLAKADGFYLPPSWESMIDEMMNDNTQYDKIRSSYVI
jgi:dTDP-4-dehydrorhamnose reductase